MKTLLMLTVSDAKPLRHGMDYLWSLILDLTRETDTFTYWDVRGRCDQSHLVRVRLDLVKLVNAGFLARLPASRPKGQRPFRLLKRQSTTPKLTTGATGESKVGLGIQNMWNVMRRSRGGFTVADLAIDASTDDVTVSHQHAKQYCRMLERAGIIRKQRVGQRGVGRNIFILLGSANTGPKAPRRYKSTMIFDENQNRVVGPVEAEEIAP